MVPITTLQIQYIDALRVRKGVEMALHLQSITPHLTEKEGSRRCTLLALRP